MKTWRYLMLGVATLSWLGCSDLPSFPENLSEMGGMTGAGGSVIPNSGSGPTNASGSGSQMGGAATTGGATTTGGAATTGGATTGGGGSDSGGMSGAGPTAGTGGSMDNTQAEIEDAVKNLKGWRYENPCGYVDGHPLNDGTCNSGEICWPSAAKARFSEKKQIAIGGKAGVVYEVKLRIRGAIEPRDYPKECERLPGAPDNTIGVLTNCNGFANQAAVSFNVFELKIQKPAAVYYLNGVPVHPPHRVDAIDQQFTIKVEGQSQIDFFFDDLNGGEIRNCSITVEGIQPYPKVFDGNFFQLDVVEAKVAQ